MVYHMLEFGEIHFYYYSSLMHWSLGSNFRQKKVVLVWHSFCLEDTCFSRIVQDVLPLGNNLNKLHITYFAIRKKFRYDQKKQFFEECSWFNLNNLGLALVMSTNFTPLLQKD